MRRTLAIAATLGLALILVIVPAASGRRATKTVDVGDNFFDPTNMKIKKNDRVAFDWVGIEEHDVARAKGPGKFFESGATSTPGVNFKHKFTKKGTYKIICTLHSEMKMKIEVK
jgi:plastocyanin